MSTVDEVQAEKRDGVFKRTVLNLRSQANFAKNHWLASLFYSAFIAIGGWMLADVYNAWKPWHDNTDTRLEQIREEQAAAFKNLDDKLGTLTRNVDGDGRDALREVEGLVKDIRTANSSLLQQLLMARDENDRLSNVGGAQAGISGGYDFILTQNSGIKVDATTVVGVGNISSSRVDVRVSAEGLDGRAERRLASGEHIAFRDAKGESCRVILLSINESSAASFDVACGAG